MSAINVAKTVFFVALAASRHPAVRAAIKAAPRMVSDSQRKAAYEATKRTARKAGELTAKVIPPNRFF